MQNIIPDERYSVADEAILGAFFIGHDADEIARAVALQNEGLENGRYILAQLFGDVRRGEVLFVHPVRNQFVCDLRAVEQPRGIRLFDFGMCHIVPFIFLSAAKVV